MEIKTLKVKNNKLREKCGDCYYNGNCIIHLASCQYLKKKKIN